MHNKSDKYFRYIRSKFLFIHMYYYISELKSSVYIEGKKEEINTGCPSLT